MTTVTHDVGVVSRFVWRVPTNYSPGAGQVAPIGDFDDAREMARAEAIRQGITVTCDDWAQVMLGDDHVAVFFDVETSQLMDPRRGLTVIGRQELFEEVRGALADVEGVPSPVIAAIVDLVAARLATPS